MPTRTIKTKKGSVTLVEPGIIRFSLNEDVKWTLEDAKETHKANLSLANNGKFFVYMNAKRFFLPSKEAQQFISTKECTDHRIGAAFVVPNAGMHLLANMFMKFFNKKSPARIFKTETEAFKWMRTEYKKITGE